MHAASWMCLSFLLAENDHGPKGGIPGLTGIVIGFFFLPGWIAGVVLILIFGYRLLASTESHLSMIAVMTSITLLASVVAMGTYH